jgi:hypothetical protein
MIFIPASKKEGSMPLDSLVVTIVVVAGFAAFAGTLAWTSWSTNRNTPGQ